MFSLDWSQLMHHSFTLLGYTVTFYMGRSATDALIGLFIAEAANPFMYLRYLFWSMGMADTRIGVINRVSIYVAIRLYICCRGCDANDYRLSCTHDVNGRAEFCHPLISNLLIVVHVALAVSVHLSAHTHSHLLLVRAHS